MAERSIIDGFGPGVSKWASEATAKEIANTLSDIKSLTAGQKSKIEDMAKAASMTLKLSKNLLMQWTTSQTK